MSRSMPRSVKNIERAVAEEVEAVEGPEFEALAFALEVEFVNFAAFDVGFEEGRVGGGGEAGHEFCGEAGTDGEGCAGGEGG